MNLGVIIGRFQVPELHAGHKHLIEFVKRQHGHVLVLLGVTPILGSKRNPLDYPTREKMLLTAYPELTVAPLPDMPSDQVWSENLDAIVKLLVPVGKVTLYGGRDSFIPYYHGHYPKVEIELDYAPSGTDVRQVTANMIRVSTDFRAGIIYGIAHQFDRVFPTVDIALVKSGIVLMAKKPNESLYRFPGGFVSQSDQSLESAAQRECLEETGYSCAALTYLGSFHSKDWRYTHKDDGNVMTTLFISTVFAGQDTPGDDVSELKWMSLLTTHEGHIVTTHHPLLKALKTYFKTPQEVAYE